MDIDDVTCKKSAPKPKDTQKQSTLPKCLTSARSAKAVRHASHSTVVLVKLKTCHQPLVAREALASLKKIKICDYTLYLEYYKPCKF
jgi:hypothetical protein